MNQGEWIEFSALCSRLKGDPPLYMDGSPAVGAVRADVRRERWNHETREWEEIE